MPQNRPVRPVRLELRHFQPIEWQNRLSTGIPGVRT